MSVDARKPAIFFAGTSALLNIYSTQPLLGSLAAQWHLEGTESSWTISATTLAIALCAPIAGSISDRVGRKRVMVLATAGMSFATALCALAPTLAVLLALRFVQGLFVPFVFAVAVAYIDEEWAYPQSARINSLYVSGSVFGGFCGRFLSGIVASLLGWRAAFLVLATITAGISVLVGLALPHEQRFRAVDSVLTSLRNARLHLRNRTLLATCLVGACILFAQVASFSYAALHLAAPPYSLDTAALGAIFAVFLIGVVATPMAGRAIVRFGRLQTLGASIVLCWFGLLLCLVSATSAVVIGLACCSTGVFAAQACTTGHAASVAGSAKSSGIGLYLTAYYLGGSLGAVVPGWFFVRYGFSGCVVLIAGVLLVALLSALRAWPLRSGRDAT